MPISTDNITNKVDYKTGDSPLPMLMESLTNELIVEIGCGSNHSLAINDKGEVFSWGEGIYGQLGHGVLDNEFYPRKVENLQNLRFKQVAGGATHTIAVTHDDYVFGWGSNEKNQLNLKQTKLSSTPILVPLYELIGNYTIDEIKNLNLDESNFNPRNLNVNFSNFKPILTSDLDQITIDSNQGIEAQNDLSFIPDDLMKIKLIDCGTWFTVCTSQIFPSTIYIFGNSFKRVIKITFFDQNKLEIKQISASNYQICVLTSDNSVYKLNVNNLVGTKSGTETEKLSHIPETMEIEKIGCGYNYLLILTKDKQAIYNANFGKNHFTFLNAEIRTNINDFATGPSHLFLISSLNDLYLGNFLYEKIFNYANTKQEDDNLNPDIYIQGQGDFVFPCHSIFLEQFINFSKLEKQYNILKINLTSENILILLELIYTSNLKILSTEESKKVIENPEILRNLNLSLLEISTFLNSDENKFLDNLILQELIKLINFYSKKIKEVLNHQIVTKDFELITKKLSESCNFILNSIMKVKVNDNIKSLRRNTSNDLNDIRGQREGFEDNEEDEDNVINFNNRLRGRERGADYFQRWGNKRTKVNLLSKSEENYDQNKVNIDAYLKVQSEMIDYRYQFYLKIFQTKEKLNQLKIENIRKNIKENLCLRIKNFDSIDNKSQEAQDIICINKLMLSFKSLFFNNLIKLNKIKYQNPQNIFDLNKLELSFNNDCVEKAFKFLNCESFQINIIDIFELLDISSYFMIDNLSSLLEIELEGLISKFIKYLKLK